MAAAVRMVLRRTLAEMGLAVAVPVAVGTAGPRIAAEVGRPGQTARKRRAAPLSRVRVYSCNIFR